jgi:hypothetical protein
MTFIGGTWKADTITITGITSINTGVNDWQKVNVSSLSAASAAPLYGRISAGTNVVGFDFTSSHTNHILVEGDIELDSWPTWATKGGNIHLLDNNGLYQNAQIKLSAPSGGVSGAATIPYSTEVYNRGGFTY